MQDQDSQHGTATASQHLFAYSVEEYENADGKKARAWTRIGVAFPHKDGNGLNIQLRCLPVDGRIVLFPANDEARDDDDANDHSNRDAEPPRYRNDNGTRASRANSDRRPR